jgi:hypothetical protein
MGLDLKAWIVFSKDPNFEIIPQLCAAADSLHSNLNGALAGCRLGALVIKAIIRINFDCCMAFPET